MTNPTKKRDFNQLLLICSSISYTAQSIQGCKGAGAYPNQPTMHAFWTVRGNPHIHGERTQTQSLLLLLLLYYCIIFSQQHKTK